MVLCKTDGVQASGGEDCANHVLFGQRSCKQDIKRSGFPISLFLIHLPFFKSVRLNNLSSLK